MPPADLSWFGNASLRPRVAYRLIQRRNAQKSGTTEAKFSLSRKRDRDLVPDFWNSRCRIAAPVGGRHDHQPDFIIYGTRVMTTSICRILPFSILKSSPAIQLYGVLAALRTSLLPSG